MNDEITNDCHKRDDVLSFKITGRNISLCDLANEFQIMADYLKKPLTPEVVSMMAENSGTHLLKSITPRAAVGQSVLRIQSPGSNLPDELFPSINSPEIPFAKVIFRPLEIDGYTPMSVVDAILLGDGPAAEILEAFSETFGIECLEVLKDSLGIGPRDIVALPAAEFPIIFMPTPDGGDIQITPLSPISAFMGFKEMSSPYFRKREKDEPPVARGKWTRQDISAQMQNITGKIGGPRQRLLAEMPSPLARGAVELNRFVRGGAFPYWHEPDIDTRVLHYAGLQKALADVRKPQIRAAADRMAEQLVNEALTYIDDILVEARALILEQGIETELGAVPKPSEIIYARRWSDKDKVKARRALSDPHFSRIQNEILDRRVQA